MTYIDLTHVFTKTMPVYPGDPASELAPIASCEKDGFTDHRVSTGMHVGTHVDAPLHMIKDGARIPEIAIEHFFGTGRLIDARGLSMIGSEVLNQTTIEENDIIIFMTGCSNNYRSPSYYESSPELTEELARALVAKKISMIGLDFPSPDRPPFKVHQLLLGAGILIIENLTDLEKLIGVRNFEIIALPANFDADAAPARVVAKIN